jgi:phosphatidylserine synthase
MVSDIPYPKFSGRSAMAVGTIVAVGILIMGLYVIETELELPYTEVMVILLGLMLGYLVCGPLYEISRPDYQRRERRKRSKKAR